LNSSQTHQGFESISGPIHILHFQLAFVMLSGRPIVRRGYLHQPFLSASHFLFGPFRRQLVLLVIREVLKYLTSLWRIHAKTIRAPTFSETLIKFHFVDISG
jgi:hypothetical protein